MDQLARPSQQPPTDILVLLLDRSGAVVACPGDDRRAALEERLGAPVLGMTFVQLASATGVDVSPATADLLREACAGRVPAPFRFATASQAAEDEPGSCIVTVASRLADDGTCLGATVTVQGIDDVVALDGESWTQLRDRGKPVSEALDTIDDAVIIVRTPSLWPVYANQAAASWLERTDTGGITYGSWQLLTHPALSELREALQQVASGREQRLDLLLRAVRRNGETAWLDVRVRALPSTAVVPAGRPSPPDHVLLVAHDVSDRVGAEERLRISETSFRAAFEHSSIPTLVATLHPDGGRRIVMANQALAVASGYPLETLVGSDAGPFHQRVEPEDSRRFNDAFLAGDLEQSVWLKQDVRPDGTRVWFDVFMSRIDLAGDGTPAALVHLVDVTDRILAARRTERQAQVIASHAELVTRILKGDDQGAVEQRMVDDLRSVLDADDVVLVVPDRSSDALVVLRGSGPVGRRLATARQTLDPALAARFGEARQLLVRPDGPDGDGDGPQEDDQKEDRQPRVDAVARFDVDGRRGWVAVGRQEPPLEPAELDVVGGFSRQTAMALELGRARADQERLLRLEERHRLARDLHDTVLQDLIAMGVQLGLSRKQLTGDAEARVVEIMQELVGTVRKLRAAVFQLRRPLEEDSLAEALSAVVRAAARSLGHVPTMTVSGDLERVPTGLRGDLLAALQEALSNVVRHAAARAVDVTLEVGPDRLQLEVTDDGVGPASRTLPEPGRGLSNLAERAEAAGGTSVLRRGSVRGAVLSWAVPLGDGLAT